MAALELLRPTFFRAALDRFPGHLVAFHLLLLQPLGVAVSAGLGTSPSWRPGASGLRIRSVGVPTATAPCGPLVQVNDLPAINLFESVYALS